MSVSQARESPLRICWIRKRSLVEDIRLILTRCGDKYQISNSKSQTNSNDQKLKTTSGERFWSLEFGVLKLFVIWCLGLEIYSNSQTPAPTVATRVTDPRRSHRL